MKSIKTTTVYRKFSGGKKIEETIKTTESEPDKAAADLDVKSEKIKSASKKLFGDLEKMMREVFDD